MPDKKEPGQVQGSRTCSEEHGVNRDDIRKQNEQVKAWLWRYREAKKDVRRLEEELEELTEIQESAGAIRYSDMPKGGGGQADLSDAMVKREKIWRKIQKARYKRMKVFAEIRNAIERLPTADEREVMSYRYLRLMSWEDISVRVEKKWTQTHRIHSRALENMKIYVILRKND
ncbi:hypothetical protein BRYFOR_07600 [Marvinbryantia formatexigens DSM 14469]|uniref:Phage transcriptional regulator, RinA family n=1 Tax=Marvinbryantia formatexigens DSM 14469 TaxID=478749 RepID=C6LG40_9FIRM|nr:hypothetical protein [Marvinbryantia formatexigens]EET60404.1 hypothetical protein BRYFOR_07600 [Marvinbryantia formatexigens DSM 14469]UWO25256.1 hypothetical protein NQ534_01830 [Marvinbryantia formatexigens DSM 14469]